MLFIGNQLNKLEVVPQALLQNQAESREAPDETRVGNPRALVLSGWPGLLYRLVSSVPMCEGERSQILSSLNAAADPKGDIIIHGRREKWTERCSNPAGRRGAARGGAGRGGKLRPSRDECIGDIDFMVFSAQRRRRKMRNFTTLLPRLGKSITYWRWDDCFCGAAARRGTGALP